MSQSDRGPPKCGKPGIIEADGSDLSLSGSQVSLISKPRSLMGKASARALSVSGPRVRRPMSAMPSMSFTEVIRDKRRPFSAESQPVLPSYQQKRNKFSACFSLMADPLGLTNQDVETDGDLEFSSSTLASSYLSGQQDGAWMELEMRGLYLGHPGPVQLSCSTDNGSDLFCSSDVSEEPTRSEKSLGELIQAMARDQHDQILFPQHNFFNDKKCEQVKTEKESDPRTMSTKELHLCMVESGLISACTPYNTGNKKENTDQRASQVRSPNECHQKNKPDINSCPNKNLGVKNNDEVCTSQETLKTEVRELWNEHNEFYQSANKSSCEIDQISFPKEHDVDSLEGDSAHSIHIFDSQREENMSLKFVPIHADQKNSSNQNWAKNDLVPVRFQQWMIDCSRQVESDSNRSNFSDSYVRDVESAHQKEKQCKASPDCIVEEVSTDSEYFKGSNSSDFQVEKIPRLSDSGIHSGFSTFDSNSTILDERHLSFQIQEEDGKEDNSSQQASVSLDQTDFLTQSFHEGKHQAVESVHAENTVHQKFSAGNLRQEDPLLKKKPLNIDFGGTEKKSDRKDTSKSTRILANTSKRSLAGPKRKTLSKGDLNANRCRKNLPIQHPSQAKEESLPEETQPELLSWMAMCSADSERNDSVESLFSNMLNHVPTPAVGDESKDSPYSEIMTILRVLEDKEDESSLMKIINKRSESKFGSSSNDPTRTAPLSQDVPSTPATNSVSQQIDNTGCGAPEFHAQSSDSLKLDWSANNSSEVSKPADLSCGTPDTVSPASAPGELRDLLTFLDAVDKSCSSVLQPKQLSDSKILPLPMSSPEDSHNSEELLLMGRSDLAQEIVTLRLTLEDRDATINLLRTALREQKDNQARQVSAHTKELQSRIKQVKEECEAVIKRHQKFIDQLIADKASLSERCQLLVQEAKESEEKHAKEVSNMEGKHKVEMQRVKDITAATEKLKRERWVENKTQKIKELTVRGLEPELTRLTAQHEQEMAALRTLHSQEIEQMELRAARRASQQMESLREQLIHEKEEALARERDLLRQRMEKQQLLFEEEGAEQRRRLVAEVRREQDRLATLEARLEAQFEERKRVLERESDLERERVRRDYADKLNEMHRKQQTDLLQMREALKAEKESWIESYQQQQKQAFAQTTHEIRDQLKRERDKEIEIVIERLEKEATISREEKEKAAENRLRRVREQLTSELRDVESALNSLKDKHIELRAQVQEKEDKLVSSETLNRSLHTQLVETQKIADQLSAERADLKQTLRSELIHEMENLRQQLSEQHSRHQQQLKVLAEQAERERQTHQQELQQLYDRVKLAIAKKEEVVKVAKAKQRAAEEQNSHLQALLEHRRKESLLSS